MLYVHLLSLVRPEDHECSGGAQTVFLRDVSCPKCLDGFGRATLPERDRKPAQRMSVAEEGELITRKYARLPNPKMRIRESLETMRVNKPKRADYEIAEGYYNG